MYKLPENMDNKYKFVTLASKRAEQLQGGAVPRVPTSGRRATVLAQEEVATGQVDVWAPAEERLEETAEEEE